MKRIRKSHDFSKIELLCDFKKCAHCSYCRDLCPTFMISGKESDFIGGKIRIFRGFTENRITPDKEFTDMALFCTTCKLCQFICPIHVPVVEIIESVRSNLISQQLLPDTVRKIHRNILENGNPFGDEHDQRSSWLMGESVDIDAPITAHYTFFAGCMASFREQESAYHSWCILKRFLGSDIILLKEKEFCCGSPLFRTGQCSEVYSNGNHAKFNDGYSLIRHNIQVLTSLQVKTVITGCAGCYKTITQDWPNIYGQPIPFTVIPFVNYIASIINEKVWNGYSFPKIVTYHDPCHLGRHCGIYDPPRQVLRDIPGLIFREMLHNRENAICCGAGGGVRAGFHDQSLQITQLRLKEAVEIGAEMLVTACPFCKHQLRESEIHIKTGLVIVNIEDLLFDLLFNLRNSSK